MQTYLKLEKKDYAYQYHRETINTFSGLYHTGDSIIWNKKDHILRTGIIVRIPVYLFFQNTV